jgi:3-oxoacyl-[acyl-carrier-protein] synthase II
MKLPVKGMAWTTPLGDDLELVWDRLLRGETQIAPVPHMVRLRSSLAAAVNSTPADLPPSVRLHCIAKPTVERALAAARQDPADPQLRLVVGTSLGAYIEEATQRKSLSAWANELSHAVGLTTQPIVISTACSSGSDAILVGAEMIRAGLARCCVCGGVDVLTVSKRLAHSALGTMSPTMLRAFDVRHDGTLLGEGAAFVVLRAPEEEAGTPLAYLRGVGSANDATGMTAPDAAGLGGRLAVERSLADAGLEPAEIGLINAHASGTPLNDASERATFADVFGGRARPLVFATKGNFGHSLGATGAIEAVALLLALQSGRVPPIVGLEQPDPGFPLPLAYPKETSCDARFGISLTLGFGGFDTSLIFEVPR